MKQQIDQRVIFPEGAAPLILMDADVMHDGRPTVTICGPGVAIVVDLQQLFANVAQLMAAHGPSST